MKRYFSLDIEALVHNPNLIKPKFEHVIQFALVADDLDDMKPLRALPRCVFYIKQDKVEGDHSAIAFNAEHMHMIASGGTDYPIIANETLPEDVESIEALVIDMVSGFVDEFNPESRQKPLVVGKNLGGYDMRFLPPEIVNLFHYRFGDIGNLYSDLTRNYCLLDESGWMPIPGVEEALNIQVSHDAYYDALAAVRGMRQKWITANGIQLKAKDKARLLQVDYDGDE